MSIKKKLGMGIATAVLGVGLIGGGSFAYFSDTVEAESTFASGTLDIGIDKEKTIVIDNLKPGDTMKRSFTLENNGSLDMSKVLLDTKYTVKHVKGDFGKHIMVKFMENDGESDSLKGGKVLYEKSLFELKKESPDLLTIGDSATSVKGNDLESGKKKLITVEFEFKDNGGDQNHLQGAGLELKWIFDAIQTKGEER